MASGGGGNKVEDVVTDRVYRNPLYTSTPRQIDPQDEVQGDPVTSPPPTEAGAQTLFKSTPSVQDPSVQNISESLADMTIKTYGVDEQQ